MVRDDDAGREVLTVAEPDAAGDAAFDVDLDRSRDAGADRSTKALRRRREGARERSDPAPGRGAERPVVDREVVEEAEERARGEGTLGERAHRGAAEHGAHRLGGDGLVEEVASGHEEEAQHLVHLARAEAEELRGDRAQAPGRLGRGHRQLGRRRAVERAEESDGVVDGAGQLRQGAQGDRRRAEGGDRRAPDHLHGEAQLGHHLGIERGGGHAHVGAEAWGERLGRDGTADRGARLEHEHAQPRAGEAGRGREGVGRGAQEEDVALAHESLPSRSSRRMAMAALRPGAPVMQPPGWVLEPHIHRFFTGVRYCAQPGAGRRKKI